jgi:hypothetical protein
MFYFLHRKVRTESLRNRKYFGNFGPPPQEKNVENIVAADVEKRTGSGTESYLGKTSRSRHCPVKGFSKYSSPPPP